MNPNPPAVHYARCADTIARRLRVLDTIGSGATYLDAELTALHLSKIVEVVASAAECVAGKAYKPSGDRGTQDAARILTELHKQHLLVLPKAEDITTSDQPGFALVVSGAQVRDLGVQRHDRGFEPASQAVRQPLPTVGGLPETLLRHRRSLPALRGTHEARGQRHRPGLHQARAPPPRRAHRPARARARPRATVLEEPRAASLGVRHRRGIATPPQRTKVRRNRARQRCVRRSDRAAPDGVLGAFCPTGVGPRRPSTSRSEAPPASSAAGSRRKPGFFRLRAGRRLAVTGW